MATPTQSDSYWLSQSTVFKNRCQTALIVFCNTIETEIPTGVSGTMPTLVHIARMNFVKTIMQPSQFSSWLTLFTNAAASDGNVINAATQVSTTYTPITTAAQGDTAAADGQTPLVSTSLISNAIAAAFDTYVPGI